MRDKICSSEEYKRLAPKIQGYVSYMQGAWNKEVPELCPYPPVSKEADAWHEGQGRAVIEVQDSEE